MILKIRAQQANSHTHVGFWMGNTEGSLGKCGDLVFRNEEWPIFSEIFGYGGKPEPRPIGVERYMKIAKFRNLTVLIEEMYDAAE